MIMIREATATDHSGILRVAQNLEGWFDEHARQIAIPMDIRYQDVFVAVASGDVLGFVSLYVADGRLNIGWLGVRRSHHRRGIGSLLLKKVEEHARMMGIPELAVMTLGDSVDYAPYEQTRSFYKKQGFVERQRNKTDNPGCPEELRLVRRL